MWTQTSRNGVGNVLCITDIIKNNDDLVLKKLVCQQVVENISIIFS